MSRKGRITAVWVCCAAILIAVLLMMYPYLFSASASAATIRIPRNAKAADVEDSIARYMGEDYARHAIRLFNLLEKNPQQRYGAYDIPEGSSPAEAARILARGSQSVVKFTVNGVREFDSFIPRIAAKFDFSADDLRQLLATPTTLRPYGLTPEQAPALFLNDTYFLYWNSTPEALIAKMGENYNKFWNEKNLQKAQALGLSPAEVTIIASIVDEETNKQQEKGRIGRLYINRLQKGMRLQADPTVRFALKDFTIKRVTSEHTRNAPLPYNTYRAAGLPPGPIRTTSTATLQAILDSEPSSDLYMCAKEDFSGFHNFASNYEDHQRNARAYQNALNERNIH